MDSLLFLDLFCGGGGAAMGLKRGCPRARIIGIDLYLHPHYPFEFVLADALRSPFDLSRFDFIWASPKCQAHTSMNNVNRARGRVLDHISQIEDTRRLLLGSGKPFIIENVIGAPLFNPVLLRGFEFGLGVDRPRLFESNCLLFEPPPKRPDRNSVAVYGRLDGRPILARKDGTSTHAAFNLVEAQEAMGIDWMDEKEITQAVPPVYAEYLIRQIFQ